MARGTGTTTKQMKGAPQNAVFIWCNAHVEYAVDLAHRIGRGDLQIKRQAWLRNCWRGVELTGVVVDHAAKLSSEEWNGLLKAKARIGIR